MWGGLFSTFDCAVKGIRKKEDAYNAIVCLPAEVNDDRFPTKITNMS